MNYKVVEDKEGFCVLELNEDGYLQREVATFEEEESATEYVNWKNNKGKTIMEVVYGSLD